MHAPLQVLASVFGPREVAKRGERLEDRALIKCEYSMAAFSTGGCKGCASGLSIRVCIRLAHRVVHVLRLALCRRGGFTRGPVP